MKKRCAECSRFGFNGMEKNDEITGGNYDFGNRIYDGRIGKFLSVDRFAGKYPSISPYSFALNNPIRVVDIGGDSVWVNMSGAVTRNNQGKLVKVNYINITISILDVSNRNISKTDMNDIRYKIERGLTDGLKLEKEAYLRDPNGGVKGEIGKEIWKARVTVKIANSMKDVDGSDHLIAIVDDVSYDEPLGGIFGYTRGVSIIGGKIAYAQTYPNYFWSFPTNDELSTVMIHEIGHSLGLLHTWEDGYEDTGGKKSSNYMSYGGDKRNTFSRSQVLQIINNRMNLNQGENFEILKNDKGASSKTSTTNPSKDSAKKGEKIPKTISN